MMKKNYIAPHFKTICLTHTESMLAGSNDPDSTKADVGDEIEYSRQQGSPIWDAWSN